MPRIARETWKEFKLGVGIYTIQGFEKCDQESKYIYRHYTNKRNNETTNVAMQILKRLQLIYA